jgi:hypothetical protein
VRNNQTTSIDRRDYNKPELIVNIPFIKSQFNSSCTPASRKIFENEAPDDHKLRLVAMTSTAAAPVSQQRRLSERME